MRLFVIALMICLAGCTTTFKKPGPIASYGNPPANYQETIREHFKFQLFDPFTAQYDFSDPYKAYANQGLVYGGDVAFIGYAVDVRINAKNRLGGYTGWHSYTMLFVENTIVKEIDQEGDLGSGLVHRAPL